jgi:putative transposase
MMKRSRFTQEQIIGVLKEHHAGATAPDLCRKHGISEATFYAWRSKYGSIQVSDARKLKGLEEENARLKKLLAESMLDVSTLREMLAKTSDARLAEESRDLGEEKDYSQRHACQLVGLAPKTFRYVSLCLAARRRWRGSRSAASPGE